MHDRGEVVVGEDHDRGLLGDLGAGDPHRHADVGLLQRRRVVDAVARHRHDVAGLLQRLDESDLVLRRDASDDADGGQAGGELVVAQRGELGAGERFAGDAQLGADRGSGDRVVAGDHPHLDAGAVALGDGRLGLGAWRIDDADHGQEREVLDELDQVAVRIERGRIEVTPRHHHDPLALLGHPIVLVDGQMAVLVGHGARSPSGSQNEPPRSISTSGAPLTKHRTTARPFSSVTSWNVAMNL